MLEESNLLTNDDVDDRQSLNQAEDAQRMRVRRRRRTVVRDKSQSVFVIDDDTYRPLSRVEVLSQ